MDEAEESSWRLLVSRSRSERDGARSWTRVMGSAYECTSGGVGEDRKCAQCVVAGLLGDGTELPEDMKL